MPMPRSAARSAPELMAHVSSVSTPVVAIQRNSVRYPIPTGDMRIFPGDIIGVIGTDEQIQALLPLLEATAATQPQDNIEVKFTHFPLSDTSPLLGVRLGDTSLREDYKSMIVAIERGQDNFLTPTPDIVFQPGDVLWAVGDVKLMKKMR